jgi:catechol 2,3-dioxygenase-like lactoylglutathione lyase family enzyme
MKSFTKASVKGMTPLIMAFDMAKSLHFYCDLLGFKLIQFAGPTDDIGWAQLKPGEIELMLNTMYERDNRPDRVNQLRQQLYDDIIRASLKTLALTASTPSPSPKEKGQRSF